MTFKLLSRMINSVFFILVFAVDCPICFYEISSNWWVTGAHGFDSFFSGFYFVQDWTMTIIVHGGTSFSSSFDDFLIFFSGNSSNLGAILLESTGLGKSSIFQ